MTEMLDSPLDGSIGCSPPYPIMLQPWRLASTLAGVVLAVAVIDIVGYALIGPEAFRNHASLRQIDLRLENNGTTFFSALMLLGAAASCLINAYGYPQSPDTGIGRFLPGWRVLALIFMYLAFDEAAQFHEQLTRFGPHPTGVLAFVGERSWVLFYVPPALAIGVAFLPFLRRLGRRDACLVVLAGTIYVTSAAGIETVGAWLRVGEGLARGDMVVALCGLTEETGEVLGIILFIGAALSHAARHGAAFAVQVTHAARSASPSFGIAGAQPSL